MGYRSEVGAVLAVPVADHARMAAIIELEMDSADPLPFKAYPSEEKNAVYYVLHVSYVKWYDEYDCVKAYYRIVRSLQELDTWALNFLRIGEEYEDIEVISESSDNEYGEEMLYDIIDLLSIDRRIVQRI